MPKKNRRLIMIFM